MIKLVAPYGVEEAHSFSTTSKIPSLSSSTSKISGTPSLSVSSNGVKMAAPFAEVTAAFKGSFPPKTAILDPEHKALTSTVNSTIKCCPGSNVPDIPSVILVSPNPLYPKLRLGFTLASEIVICGAVTIWSNVPSAHNPLKSSVNEISSK